MMEKKTHEVRANVLPHDTLSPNAPTFTPFPRLPFEPRYKIWAYAHPSLRNVIISLGTFSHKLAINSLALALVLGFAALLVNHEASEIFLKHYPKIFIGDLYPKPNILRER